VKKWQPTNAAPQRRKRGLAAGAFASAARDMATGSNRVVLGPTPQGVAKEGGDEVEMADVDEEEEAVGLARDVTMAETETAHRTAIDTEDETEAGALATND